MLDTRTTTSNTAAYAERMEALYRISVQLTDNLDSEEVVQEVLDYSIDLLRARNGSVMLIDPDSEVLRVKVARGLDEDVYRSIGVKLGEGISGYVAQTGQAKNLAKGFKDRYSQTDGDASEVEAALCIPLKARNEVIGVLNLSGRENGDNFSEEDISLAQTLASQAAAAIANATLYDTTEKNRRELEALYRVGQKLTSSLNRDDILHLVLDQATELLNAENGSLMLIAEDGEYLEIVAAHGLSTEVIAKARPRLGKGIAGFVAVTGQPKVLKSGFKDRYSQTSETADGVKSSICVPLKAKEQILGVLNVSGKKSNSDFNADDLRLLLSLAYMAAAAIENATLYRNITDMFNDSIKALASAIDARDPYTEQHSQRVSEYSVIIAEEMELPEEEIEQVRIGALLHDVGKIGVKEAILQKPGRLTDDELTEMKGHPVTSGNIMSAVRRFKTMLPILYHHHEAFAGKGYPHGLTGQAIPFQARIVAVADTFDAMTSDRPYRKGLPLEVAEEEIRKNIGIQFDPKCAEAFLQAVQKGRIQLPNH